METEKLEKVLKNHALNLESEIKKEEGGEGFENKGEPQNENNGGQSKKHHRFTLGRMLSLMGGSDNSPYVSAIKKLHAILGTLGARGLDESGKTSIKNCISDIDKFSPEIAEILKESLENYGYDLDVEIPHEGALMAFYGFVAYKITNVRKSEVERMGATNENKSSTKQEPRKEAWK